MDSDAARLQGAAEAVDKGVERGIGENAPIA